MSGPSSDIPQKMRVKTEAASSGDASARSGQVRSTALTAAEFSTRLASASKTLWLIAAAVLGRREGAEDVVQESAVIGLQKIQEFHPETNFAAWMGGIVRNVARNSARKSIRRHTGVADPADLDQTRPHRAGPQQDPEFDRHGQLAAGQGHFDDRVISALNSLEETPRVCLLLRTMRQMPYRDIAALLEIPEGTAMSHVHRARLSMREALLRNADGDKRV